jgi:hypothetical protein
MRTSGTRRLVGLWAMPIAVLAVCFTPITPAWAADLYVDKDSVSGGCSDARARAQVTAAAPWCSLARAVDQSQGGDVILLRRGAYPMLDLDADAPASYVTIKSFPGEQAQVAGFEMSRAQRWRLEGLELTEPSVAYNATAHIQLVGNEITGGGVKLLHDVSDVLYANNHVHHIPLFSDAVASVGLWAGGSPAPSQITIRDNRFERLPNDALFLSARDVLIERNWFQFINSPDNNRAHADVVQTMGLDGLVMRNNVSLDNDSGLLNSVASANDWRVENNLFARSKSQNIQLDNENRDLIFVNNTIWDSPNSVLFRWDSAYTANPSGFVIANNVMNGLHIDPRLNIAVEDYNLIPGNDGDGAHDISAQPQFVNPAANDYRLAAGSAGIGAGTDQYGAPSTDLAGNARTVPYDIGAYESGGGSPPPPPNQGPDASFTWSPASPAVGQQVTFSSASTDPDGIVLSQAWDLDNDGSFDDGTGTTASRSFGTEGLKTVRLRVVDDDGAAAVSTATVQVSSTAGPTLPAPAARFTVTPAAAVTGTQVTFDGSGSTCGAPPCSYTWKDVGPNGTGDWPLGSGTVISFTFNGTGTKYVRLTLTDALDRTATANREVVVTASSGEEPPPPEPPVPPVEQPGSDPSGQAPADGAATAPLIDPQGMLSLLSFPPPGAEAAPLRLRVWRQAGRGLVLRVRCSRPCRAGGRILGVGAGRGSSAEGFHRNARVRLPLPRGLRSQIRHTARRGRVTRVNVRVWAVDAGGVRATRTLTLSLRRLHL